MRELNLILGDMLFEDLSALPASAPIWMMEDRFLCERVKHHQQKIVLFLSAMRHFRDAQAREVIYRELDMSRKGSIFDFLRADLRTLKIDRLHTFEPNDRYFKSELEHLCAVEEVELVTHPSPMFLTPQPEWDRFARDKKHLLMGSFYQQQRKRLDILIDSTGAPVGGHWSFDEANRKKLPRNVHPPAIWFIEPDRTTRRVIDLVTKSFPDHYGNAEQFRYPVRHEEAEDWLEEFVSSRLPQFGDYEDAVSTDERTLFHGVLTPMLNLGLLTPNQVLRRVLSEPNVPLNSKEGFVRQLVGWREFMKKIDGEYAARGYDYPDPPEDKQHNFFNHQRKLKECWWKAETGLPPIDMAIRRVVDHAWCHHIERLMILGSSMLILEIHPQHVYDWFMELFIDSADWVMVPNVFGMSQFADGGVFATKPYISSSSYLLKMSNLEKGPWCDVWDGLFWRFIGKHRDLFVGHPRMKFVIANLDKLDGDRLQRMTQLAEAFQDRVTSPL